MTDPGVEQDAPRIDAECVCEILDGAIEVLRRAPDPVFDDSSVLEVLAEALDVIGEKVQMSGRRRRLTS